MNLLVLGTLASTLMLGGCGYYFKDVDMNSDIQNSSQMESEVKTSAYDILSTDEKMSQSTFYRGMGMTCTSEGYYKVDFDKDGYYISYCDLESGSIIKWCSRADCDHTDAAKCSAIFDDTMYKRWIVAYDGKIYQLRFADDGGYLMRRELDESNLTQVAKLWDSNALYQDVEYDSPPKGLIVHDGYIYYLLTEDNQEVFVYRTALDGSVTKELVHSFKWYPEQRKGANSLYGIGDYVYICSFPDKEGTASFAIRYNTIIGEKDNIYLCTEEGELSGMIKRKIPQIGGEIEPYADKILYYSDKDGRYIIYDTTNGKEIEMNSLLHEMWITTDGKYIVTLKENELTGSAICTIFDMDMNEVMSFDLLEHFPIPGKSGSYDIHGIDDRYIVFQVRATGNNPDGSKDGTYILDIRCLDTGIIEFKKICNN